ncbi:dihydroneopterin triphosphate diphosphatase [Acidiferrobacter sp. SPIII_3]|jgi:dATP pyrophosphohydrolase|uniref:dihydroneopterin triphosphate diphosphatase n=1 Tax=Acidiferrobacter sp. SPIII_3 TaxID=1281578 RepID=UPI000D734B9B|nr:dihydroneopterin triphosphate diphosphatase [Acidiferrobacter sp. SPIII_3]AWP24272.1 dihydroneopterin triphosphate diphosphatase [Acidiferrobacter sp. SPIII_3]
MAAGGPSSFKRPESVLVVIFTTPGEVLLLRRADHVEFWQSVTGSLEWCEDDRFVTACRELFEETGIMAETGWRDWGVSHCYEIFPQWRHRYRPGTVHNTEHVFSLELPERVPVALRPVEHVEYEWLAWPAAVARVTSASNRWALEVLGRERGFLPS